MKYAISINGCDDSNEFTMSLAPAEHAAVMKLAAAAKSASEYGCQPTITIQEETP